MHKFEVGDHVAVLHETLKGKVVKVSQCKISFEDDNGFQWEYLADKLVKQPSKKDYKIDGFVYPKDDLVVKKAKDRKDRIVRTLMIDRTEIDLHIEEITDNHNFLSNFEIVQLQMTACRSFVQESIANRRKKIVIIHGKGQGVLKSEIHQYLDRLSNSGRVNLDYYDASFQKYGQGGATEVSF